MARYSTPRWILHFEFMKWSVFWQKVDNVGYFYMLCKLVTTSEFQTSKKLVKSLY